MTEFLSRAPSPARLLAAIMVGFLTLGGFGAAIAQEAPLASDAAVSEAETHFRLGVTLYKDGNYGEARDEFRRAAALDPEMEKAREYAQKAEARINLSAMGVDPAATPVFETFDPESLGPLSESPQLSPEEHKIQRVRELVELGKRYLEFQIYEPAQDLFEQALLIAPGNKRAQDGLHKATIGGLKAEIEDIQQKNELQNQRMRTHAERLKLLSEDADPSGIKSHRISVPTIEERSGETKKLSHIEEILQSPVGVVFEDIHLRDILEFIIDTYEINIVVDGRIVAAPVDEDEETTSSRGSRRGSRRSSRGGGGQGVMGMIDYINLKNVPLGDALIAILRPLELDYSIESSFIWISTPETIRTESFEKLETRYIRLNYIGSETMHKVLLDFNEVTGDTGGGGGGGGGDEVTSEAVFEGLDQAFSHFTSDDQLGEEPSRFARGSRSRGEVYRQGRGGLGPEAGLDNEPWMFEVIRSLVPEIYEPGGEGTRLSYMFYQVATNTLIVHNTPTNLDILEKQLKIMDVAPKQVSIESKFLTINITDIEKAGFEWVTGFSNRPEVFGTPIGYQGGTTTTGSIIPGPLNVGDFGPIDLDGDGDDDFIPIGYEPDGSRTFTDSIRQVLAFTSGLSPGPPGKFSLSGIIEGGKDGDRLEVTFDFLDSLAEGELLSAPRVTAMHQKTSLIMDARSEYFLTDIEMDTTTTTTGGSNLGIVTRDVDVTATKFTFGIGLAVTPFINDLNQIRMWMSPQVTSFLGEKTFFLTPTETISYPITATQQVITNVLIDDGNTVVLGGTIQDTTTKNVEKMPYLADIPVIGFFFRGKSRQVIQQSLLIFVTPEIIDSSGARYFESSL